MARGMADLSRRLRAIPGAVEAELRAQLEREAVKLVSDMNLVKPLPEIEIGWTWGDAPAGSYALARSGNDGRIRVTIYATAKTGDFPGGFPAVARWFESGTGERVTTTGARRGRITPQPYFFPVWRANRSRVQSNLRRAITRGVKKA